MAAADEQKALCQILRLLRTEGDEWFRRRPENSSPAAKVAQGKFTALGDHELKTHMMHKGGRGQFEENQVVFLKPPAKDDSAIACIWCRWDYDATPPKCGFYYGVWSAQPAFPAPVPATNVRHTAFIGYRFETPEEGDNHNFYHSQPCRSMGAKDDPIDHALPISHRDPTWPLAAKSALELLLCVVTSLYGKKGLAALREKIQEDVVLRQNPLIKAALANMSTFLYEPVNVVRGPLA